MVIFFFLFLWNYRDHNNKHFNLPPFFTTGFNCTVVGKMSEHQMFLSCSFPPLMSHIHLFCIFSVCVSDMEMCEWKWCYGHIKAAGFSTHRWAAGGSSPCTCDQMALIYSSQLQHLFSLAQAQPSSFSLLCPALETAGSDIRTNALMDPTVDLPSLLSWP